MKMEDRLSFWLSALLFFSGKALPAILLRERLQSTCLLGNSPKRFPGKDQRMQHREARSKLGRKSTPALLFLKTPRALSREPSRVLIPRHESSALCFGEMPMKLCFALILLLAAALPSRAFGGGTICTSASHAFLTEGIDGWVSDSVALRERDICVVYYPQGGTFDGSPVIVYPRVVSDGLKEFRGKNLLEQFVQKDIEEFRAHGPNLKVTDSKVKMRSKEMRAIVKDFVDGPAPNEFETVAYLASGSDVLIMVLSGHNAEDLAKFSGDFSKLLGKVASLKMSALYSFGRKEADALLKTESGKKFETDFVGSLSTPLGAAMQACAKGAKPAAASFQGVFFIAEDGTVSDFVLEKKSAIGSCVREKILNAKGKAPPAGGWRVALDMKVTS
jgi:hypothetical protein